MGTGLKRIDKSTRGVITVEYEHHEIHSGSSFTAQYHITTAATDTHRSGLYIKTPSLTTKEIHAIVEFSCSAAATFSICEAPTIAANVGTHAVVVYNRDRNSTKASTVYDNATVNAVNKVTTLTEAQIDGDATWATGTVIRTAPLQIGVGPKAAGGDTRGAQEYILKAATKYVFLITNNVATANAHYIQIDWYEHTSKA